MRHLALVLASLLCFSAFAEGNDTVQQHLATVEVVQNVKPYIEVIPAQTLSGARLEALNSHSVADALRYFAGVQLKDYGGVGGVKTLDIRSMGTNHMGVFYDGIQLGNAQNGQIDLGKFSLDNIEEISLFNGQKSEILQAAKDFGSAGTVYLRSRRPRFRTGQKFAGNVTFRTGSFGLANPSARLDFRLSDNVSATVSAEYTYANGRYKFRYRKVFSDGTLAWDTTAVRQNGDIHALRAEAGLYGFMNKGKWNAKFYYYDSEKGIPGAIVNNVWKNSQRQWDRNFFAQGSFQKELSSRYELLANSKFARDYMRYLNPDTTLMYIDNSFYQNELYLSLTQKLKILKGWEASLATDYQYNSLDATLTNFAYPVRHTLLTAIATAAEWRGLKAQASLLWSYISDRATIGSARTAKSVSKFTPAVFLSYKPWKEQEFSVRAFFKRVFRMPTFNDLYYTDIGNADLKPEFATQYNLGVVYNRQFAPGSVLSSMAFTADGYYNLVDDKIIAVPKGTGQYRWMMMNIGKVRIRGIDITARMDFRLPHDINIGGQLAYTFQKAQDYTDPTDCLDQAGTYKGQIAYIPWHSGSATLRATWQRAELDYSFIYVGERYHNSSNIRANYEQPWYTHDIAASYTLPVAKSTIKLTAELNNLFNQQYDVIQNYPMPGRNFRIILKYDF